MAEKVAQSVIDSAVAVAEVLERQAGAGVTEDVPVADGDVGRARRLRRMKPAELRAEIQDLEEQAFRLQARLNWANQSRRQTEDNLRLEQHLNSESQALAKAMIFSAMSAGSTNSIVNLVVLAAKLASIDQNQVLAAFQRLGGEMAAKVVVASVKNAKKEAAMPSTADIYDTISKVVSEIESVLRYKSK